jgi:hypothetical protein
MKRELHVQFYENLGLKCLGLLTNKSEEEPCIPGFFFKV